VIGIVSAALVQAELGVVCLPAPNVVLAALGMTLDLILDIYLVFRAFRLLARAEEDTQGAEFTVLISSVALLAWHFVYPSIVWLILEFYSHFI
jgi:hypothetical protein